MLEFGTRSSAATTWPMPTGFPVRTVDHLGDLDAILEDRIDGVIWERALPKFLPLDLTGLSVAANAECRLNTSSQDVSMHVGRFLRDQALPDGEAIRWMEEDVASLAMQFAKTLGAARICLRIEVVRDDACRKFHRDAVRARMICTYAGPGTEYCIGVRGSEPSQIGSVPTGCPIVLKGKAWPGSAQHLLMHRSPPLGTTGESRLVVVIDEARSL